MTFRPPLQGARQAAGLSRQPVQCGIWGRRRPHAGGWDLTPRPLRSRVASSTHLVGSPHCTDRGTPFSPVPSPPCPGCSSPHPVPEWVGCGSFRTRAFELRLSAEVLSGHGLLRTHTARIFSDRSNIFLILQISCLEDLRRFAVLRGIFIARSSALTVYRAGGFRRGSSLVWVALPGNHQHHQPDGTLAATLERSQYLGGSLSRTRFRRAGAGGSRWGRALRFQLGRSRLCSGCAQFFTSFSVGSSATSTMLTDPALPPRASMSVGVGPG